MSDTGSLLESICFYIFGIACLAPWNFFITPQTYWHEKFADSQDDIFAKNSTDSNAMQKFWDSSLSVAICGVQFIFCVIGTFTITKFTRQTRFTVCFVLLAILFTACAILALVDTSNFKELFFGGSLSIAVLMTILSSTLNISCSVEASEFHLLTPFLSGQSVAGILAAIANILCIAFADQIAWEAFAFFLSALFLILLAWGAYGFVFGCCERSISDYDQIDYNENEINSPENQPLLLPTDEKAKPESHLEIAKIIWPELAALTFTFAVTIAVFPTLVSTFVPVDGYFPDKFFSPVFCFLSFNLVDFIGREIAGHLRSLNNRKLLGAIVVLRFSILFLLPLTNCQPRSLPVIFTSDWVFILLMILLGLTNGLAATISFRSGANAVAFASTSRASAMMTTFLTLGLTLGALSSFVVVMIVTN
ncbi:unnamed protein product [Oikopleura dioica]|uniref:Uncharacterized protein n=1 Tax=Oikopleura dioica TaxID=34765 RepID=E4WSN1_OIKDI|nr:unnamed protein product [Oikopleura dioica]